MLFCFCYRSIKTKQFNATEKPRIWNRTGKNSTVSGNSSTGLVRYFENFTKKEEENTFSSGYLVKG